MGGPSDKNAGGAESFARHRQYDYKSVRSVSALPPFRLTSDRPSALGCGWLTTALASLSGGRSQWLALHLLR